MSIYILQQNEKKLNESEKVYNNAMKKLEIKRRTSNFKKSIVKKTFREINHNKNETENKNKTEKQKIK